MVAETLLFPDMYAHTWCYVGRTCARTHTFTVVFDANSSNKAFFSLSSETCIRDDCLNLFGWFYMLGADFLFLNFRVQWGQDCKHVPFISLRYVPLWPEQYFKWYQRAIYSRRVSFLYETDQMPAMVRVQSALWTDYGILGVMGLTSYPSRAMKNVVFGKVISVALRSGAR